MNQKEFAYSWDQFKQHVSPKWSKVTDQDLQRIDGNLASFDAVIERHYGQRKDEVSRWAHRWYCHWSGRYENYQ